MTLAGSKRSSPNDITMVPEKPLKPHDHRSVFGQAVLDDDDEIDPLGHIVAATNPSKLVNEFRIEETVGSGTFGTVYRVKSLIDGQYYAVKQSQRQFRSVHEKNRMMHEVEALAAIATAENQQSGSSDIVKFYSAWIEDDYLCIQRELCCGNVENLVEEGGVFAEPDVLVLLRNMSGALSTLHRYVCVGYCCWY